MDFVNNFSLNPSQGEWSLTFTGAQEPLLRVALVLLTLAILFFSWMSLGRVPSMRKRLLIMSLRSLATLALALMILEPQIEKKEVARIKNKVALIFDSSRSMTIKGRFHKIKDCLQENMAFLEYLNRDFDVDFLSFSDKVKEADRKVLEEGLALEGTSTDLATLLRDLKKRYQDRPTSGFLLFSDGADTSNLPPAERREELGRLAGQLPAPLFAFTPPPEEYKDISVTGVSSDSFAFVRNPWNIQVNIKVKGYSGLTLPVILKEGENILLTRPLTVEPGKEDYTILMKATPYSPGSFLYTINVPVMADELISENNSASVVVPVIRDKIRVLHLCGRPSWDELFLRRILKKDPSIDLISFFILRTPTDLAEAPSRELSLIPFPAEELFTKVLDGFDLVIFQNFDYRPYDSSLLRFSYYLANIKRFVTDTGGGFLMVGGDLAFSQGGYDGTPVEDILPVELDEEKDHIDTQDFRPIITPQGQSHPITTLEYDEARNTEAWQELPELRGFNMVRGAKPGALALGVNPRGNLPVFAIQDIGKGRTMALLTDDSWRWNFLSVGRGGGNRHYVKFWRNAVRWLIKDPSLNLVHISPQKEEYLQGEEAHLKMEVYGRDYRPLAGASMEVEVVNAETGEKVLEKTLVSPPGGQSYLSLKPPGGFYKARLRARVDQDELGQDSTLFAIRCPREEFREPLINEALLREVARASGGRLFSLPAANLEKDLSLENPPVVRLLGKRSIPLWDNWLFFTLFLGAMVAEWWVRKVGRV